MFGLVPYVIYMPNMSKNDIEFIQNNGGEITHLVECFTVQIFKNSKLKIKEKLKMAEQTQVQDTLDRERSQVPIEEYYPGNIVSYQWLIDMHIQQERLPMEHYIILKIEYPMSMHDSRAERQMAQLKQMKKLSG